MCWKCVVCVSKVSRKCRKKIKKMAVKNVNATSARNVCLELILLPLTHTPPTHIPRQVRFCWKGRQSRKGCCLPKSKESIPGQVVCVYVWRCVQIHYQFFHCSFTTTTNPEHHIMLIDTHVLTVCVGNSLPGRTQKVPCRRKKKRHLTKGQNVSFIPPCRVMSCHAVQNKKDRTKQH